MVPHHSPVLEEYSFKKQHALVNILPSCTTDRLQSKFLMRASRFHSAARYIEPSCEASSPAPHQIFCCEVELRSWRGVGMICCVTLRTCSPYCAGEHELLFLARNAHRQHCILLVDLLRPPCCEQGNCANTDGNSLEANARHAGTECRQLDCCGLVSAASIVCPSNPCLVGSCRDVTFHDQLQPVWGQTFPTTHPSTVPIPAGQRPKTYRKHNANSCRPSNAPTASRANMPTYIAERNTREHATL